MRCNKLMRDSAILLTSHGGEGGMLTSATVGDLPCHADLYLNGAKESDIKTGEEMQNAE